MARADQKENRGGARKGAGRKPLLDYSEDFKQNLKLALVTMADRHGVAVEEILASMPYETELAPSVRLAAIKLIQEAFVTKKTEKEITKREIGPAVLLPEEMPEPVRNVQ